MELGTSCGEVIEKGNNSSRSFLATALLVMKLLMAVAEWLSIDGVAR